MKAIICKDYEEMSKEALKMIIQVLEKNPNALVSFPGGDTPKRLIELFVEAVNQGSVDISKASFVSLDEWVSLDASDKGSCGHFLQTTLFSNLKKQFSDQFVLNGKAEDLGEECQRLNDFIANNDGIDISVLGIGLNGHLGFNEDGVDFDQYAHVTELSETTKAVMGKYFDKDHHLTHGITQGIKHIMEAKKVIILANGEKKAGIVKEAMAGEVSSKVPASILQRHKDSFMIVEKDAGSLL